MDSESSEARFVPEVQEVSMKSRLSNRQKAARKAARTRAVNRFVLKRWREVDQPSSRRMDVLLNMILPAVRPITLRWNPLGDVNRKLKHDAQYGELIKFVNGGRLLLVLPEGYKRPQVFHPGLWEPIYEDFEEVSWPTAR